MGLKLAIGLAIIFAIGCNGTGATVASIPIDDRTESVIVIIERLRSGDQRDVEEIVGLSASASASAMESVLRRRVAGGGKIRLVALLLDRPLADYGLSPGAISLAPPDAADSRALPMSHARFTTTIEGGSSSIWSRLVAPAPEIDDLRIPPDPRAPACSFSFQPITLDGLSTRARLAVLADDGAVVIGTERFDVVRLTSDGSFTRMSELETLRPTAAARDGDEVWIATEDGRVMRGRLGARFEMIEELPSIPDTIPAWLAPDAIDRDAFALSRGGILWRLQGTAWTRAGELSFRGESIFGGLARLGTGEAIAVLGTSPEVGHYFRDRLVQEPLEDSTTAGIGAVVSVPGLGTVVAPEDGTLHRLEEDGWKALDDASYEMTPCAAAAYQGGVFLAGRFSQVAYYHPDEGVCFMGTAARRNLHGIVVTGDELLVVGDDDAGMNRVIATRVRRTR